MLGNKGRTGQVVSKEERLKRSLALKGRVSPMKGKKHSLEARKKISISLVGRPVSDENKRKFVERMKKVVFTPERRKELGKHFVGKKPWNWKGGLTKLEQAGRPQPTNCEICEVVVSRGKAGICFDHDHKTGKFRGWICTNCNFILGHSHDNPEVLRKIIIYLEHHAF